jgi:phosphatidylglycerophosphate synthase
MQARVLALRPADWITLVRLAAAPPLVLFVSRESWSLAAATVVLAIATDWYDGRLARRVGPASYGSLLDHGADACFVVAGLGALAAVGQVSPWLAPLVTLAFFQYVYDSCAHRGEPLRASVVGRINGIAYYALVAFAIGREVLSPHWPPVAWIWSASVALATTTAVSMVQRARWATRRAAG